MHHIKCIGLFVLNLGHPNGWEFYMQLRQTLNIRPKYFCECIGTKSRLKARPQLIMQVPLSHFTDRTRVEAVRLNVNPHAPFPARSRIGTDQNQSRDK